MGKEREKTTNETTIAAMNILIMSVEQQKQEY